MQFVPTRSGRHRALRILRNLVAGALLGGLAAVPAARAGERTKEYLDFAADMAKRGNWREAKYRWELVAAGERDNPYVLNNIAVAMEALGQPAEARESYDRALALAKHDDRIAHNRSRFERFASSLRAGEAGADGAADREPEPRTKLPEHGGRIVKVTVELPVPPRLDLEGVGTLLVASFLGEDSALLDLNRELVRFLRGEFRKHSGLDVLPVTPPPAVPEQTLEDLIANGDFWRHLGREYGSDLIVSGKVGYHRRDVSGFQEVDRISPATGQKVRRTEFVEQERFDYEIDVLFLDGRTGALRYRDRLRRSAVYRGSSNDPIQAFYDLSESIAADVLAIVKSGTREDVRFIFKS